MASEPGKGSTFHFSIRFTRPEGDEQAAVKELIGVRSPPPSPSMS